MGRLTLLLSSFLLLVLVTVACADGESPNRVLELGRGPITEEDFRAGIRAADRIEFGSMRQLCDFSYYPEDANAAANAVPLAIDFIVGDAAPMTEPILPDMERALEILTEECARWKNI